MLSDFKKVGGECFFGCATDLIQCQDSGDHTSLFIVLALSMSSRCEKMKSAHIDKEVLVMRIKLKNRI